MVWHDNLSLSFSGNIVPSLYVVGNDIYFVGCGMTLTFNGSEVTPSAGALAMFAVPINMSNGQPRTLEYFPISGDFSVTGYYVKNGTMLFVAWVGMAGNNATVGAYSVFTNKLSISKVWQTTLPQNNSYRGNVPEILISDGFLVVPIWNLVGLNMSNGQQLFSIPFSVFHEDVINVIDGTLVNSTLYYVEIINGLQKNFEYKLIGMDLLTRNITLNVTVSIQGESFISPTPVKLEGNVLVVGAAFNNYYVVTTLGGSILWNSLEISYENASGGGTASPGYPTAVLEDGSWLLTSVHTPEGKTGLATQYFEKVCPSNGSLIWLHHFSFNWNESFIQFIPPRSFMNSMVLIIATSGHFLVYRWGDSIGCVGV